MSSSVDNKNEKFTTSTVVATVIKPTDPSNTRVIVDAKTSPSSSATQAPLYNGHPPRRAPVEEASIPQPRPPVMRDTEHEPTLMTHVSEKISHAMHSVKESAEGLAERMKESVTGVAHKTEETVDGVAHRVKDSVSGVTHKTEDKVGTAVIETGRAIERSGQAVERLGERTKKHAHSDGTRTKDDSEARQTRGDTDRDRSSSSFSSNRSTRGNGVQWSAEDEALRERVRRELAESRSGTLQSVKNWFSGHGESSSDYQMPKEFDEGAEAAKQNSVKRLEKLAEATERKMDEARRAATQWDQAAREQIADAWENARTHSLQLIKEVEAHHPPGSLAKSLQQLKLENTRMKQIYMRDVCEIHPNRPQCYDTVKKLMGLAKENTRIKVALSDKHIHKV